MTEIDLDSLKKIQIKILNYVTEFCEKNSINYWLDSGTLLGAIRHKGYIPWDDDIDIGMLRKDYDKFTELFGKENGNYEFVCYENTPDFYLPHGKVCDTSTILYEPDENGYKLAVNIDIFVYDNAPDDDKELKKMFDRRDYLRKIYNIKMRKISFKKDFLKNVVRFIRKATYYIFCPGMKHADGAIKEMIKNSKKYADENTTRVGNFTAFSRTSCNKRVFDSFINVTFEGREYKAPVGYDEWLRSFYGNYMELPPVEKRVSHHSFKAYFNDENNSDDNA